MKRFVVTVLTFGILTGTMVGCESKAANGALIGGAAGAGIGAIIGNNSKGRTGSGALIGGAVGAIGGGLIGNEMDKKDKREQEVKYNSNRSRDSERYEPRSTAVSKDDVIYWTQHGDRDGQIIERIETSGTVFRLTSKDENKLRDAGVSDEVIRAMKDTARR